MFTLVTGAPGAGKTSTVIAKLADVKNRPIFYRGIRDLALDWQELTDDEARDWHENVPDGAIIVIDEAQQLFPVRAPSRPVPPGLTALETHRHHGWDVWFITQEPGLLDSHARKIANEHFHYVRPFGAPFVVEYHSGTGAVSVSSKSELAGCNQRKKALPKKAWGLYKSAEVHTHKFRPPKILYILAAMLLIVPLAWYSFFRDFSVAGTGVEDSGIEQVGTFGPGRSSDGSVQPERKSWTELLTPEIQGLPFTAPLYDDKARVATSVPRVAACMHPPKRPRECVCYTQQGTKIFDMPWQMCAAFVRDGMFNHMAPEHIGQELAHAEARGGAAPDDYARPRVNASLIPDYTPRPVRRIN